MQTRAILEDKRAAAKVKADIFKESKGYEDHIHKQLKTMQDELTRL